MWLSPKVHFPWHASSTIKPSCSAVPNKRHITFLDGASGRAVRVRVIRFPLSSIGALSLRRWRLRRCRRQPSRTEVCGGDGGHRPPALFGSLESLVIPVHKSCSVKPTENAKYNSSSTQKWIHSQHSCPLRIPIHIPQA